MISKLKKRPSSGSFDRETARPHRKWDRAVYLALLAGFALAMLNYVAGDRMFLRADGLVLRERSLLAATSLVRVSHIEVSPGQIVSAGDVLIHADSFQVLDRLADLSMRNAELAEREAALRTQKEIAENLMPLTLERTEALNYTQAALDAPQVSGLVTVTRRETVLDSAYDVNVELVRLSAQAKGYAAELAALIEARRHVGQALDDLRAHYASGIYRANTDGVIGDIVPAKGEVFNPGEAILTVLSGTPYVLAYLPSTYLFRIQQGDRVVVSGGTLRQLGTIDSVLSVSQSVPEEFRNAFRLDETRQLARIRLDDVGKFPTFSSVHITRDRPWAHWQHTIQGSAQMLFRSIVP